MSSLSNRSRAALAAGIASILGVAVPEAYGNVLIVTNCSDSTDAASASLRAQVGLAQSGDTVDLSTNQLTCSQITLTNGEITAPAKFLTIKGPSTRTITISQNAFSRLFHHTYAGSGGSIGFYNLSLAGGYVTNQSSESDGGCILANGDVTLNGSTLSGCSAYSQQANAKGGGIKAASVTLVAATVSGNSASSYSGFAFGGAISAPSVLTFNSAISGNAATGGGGGLGLGGAIYLDGPGNGTLIRYSTIDSNVASKGGAVFGPSFVGTVKMYNSTVSGNVATISGGAIYAACAIANSTIAFNTAPYWAGIAASSPLGTYSTIIARNIATVNANAADVHLTKQTFGGYVWNGSNNLIVSTNFTPAAGVITVSSDPQLSPLANHGGRTRTHALMATSPAIDQGNNLHPFWGPNPLFADQRLGAFAREVPTGHPDIGAYERQVNDDEIFYSGFN